ncbi:MAG: hypothetical protein K2X77_32720 [Candidatus Obscuribacterales bacterium]|nr:hypothetical protein [Candidatus Obscuribacterales bacterium]
MRIDLKETSSRLLLALIPMWVGQSLPAQAEGNTPLTRTADSSNTNPNDWLHFNPYRYQPAIRLVPSPSATERQANIYSSFPSFPHDPSQANIVYGRGKKSLPTDYPGNKILPPSNIPPDSSKTGGFQSHINQNNSQNGSNTSGRGSNSLAPAGSIRIQDQFTGEWFDVDPKTGLRYPVCE